MQILTNLFWLFWFLHYSFIWTLMQCLNIYHATLYSWKTRGKGNHNSSWCFRLLINEAGTSVAHPGHCFQESTRGMDWEKGRLRPDQSWAEGSYTDQKKLPAEPAFKASNTPVFKSWIIMQRIHDPAQPTKGIQKEAWPSNDLMVKPPKSFCSACLLLQRRKLRPREAKVSLELTLHFIILPHSLPIALSSFPNQF